MIEDLEKKENYVGYNPMLINNNGGDNFISTGGFDEGQGFGDEEFKNWRRRWSSDGIKYMKENDDWKWN